MAGSGYPDMYWGVLIDALAGSMHKITKIKGSSSYNVEDYGIALAKGHGAGLSKRNSPKKSEITTVFLQMNKKKLVESGEYVPSYMWNQNGWLCSKMGLTPFPKHRYAYPLPITVTCIVIPWVHDNKGW